ncbi:MAG: type II toxin-antitoxin system HicB family antitoxin [Ktedonobacterales bacterium]
MATAETPHAPSTAKEAIYLALAYHHPRGGYIAECLAFPAVASEADTAQAALAALVSEVAAAVRAGEQEVDSEAIVTSLMVPAPDGEQHTYTAVVSRDTNSFASYCPALGVASQGETVAEALEMLHEASALYLEEQPAPQRDELVYVERITVRIPEITTETSVPPAHQAS